MKLKSCVHIVATLHLTWHPKNGKRVSFFFGWHRIVVFFFVQENSLHLSLYRTSFSRVRWFTTINGMLRFVCVDSPTHLKINGSRVPIPYALHQIRLSSCAKKMGPKKFIIALKAERTHGNYLSLWWFLSAKGETEWRHEKNCLFAA